MKGYDTASYASTRLNDTVIRKGTTPILVNNCEDHSIGKIVVYWSGIMDGAGGADFLNDLNLDPVPLGYVNYDGSVQYMTRMPMRQDWKQGLRDRNVVTYQGFNNDFSYKIIGKTIMGDFPKFSKVLERLNGGGYNIQAFDRDFALDRRGDLWYKGMFTIGRVNMTSGAVNIDDSFSWVREAFSEAMEQAA